MGYFSVITQLNLEKNMAPVAGTWWLANIFSATRNHFVVDENVSVCSSSIGQKCLRR
jgi:hypothetical protein